MNSSLKVKWGTVYDRDNESSWRKVLRAEILKAEETFVLFPNAQDMKDDATEFVSSRTNQQQAVFKTYWPKK